MSKTTTDIHVDITDDDWAETMNAANDESVVWFYEKITTLTENER